MTYLNIPTVRNASRKFCVNTGMTGTLASIAILAKPTRLKPIKILLERFVIFVVWENRFTVQELIISLCMLWSTFSILFCSNYPKIELRIHLQELVPVDFQL